MAGEATVPGHDQLEALAAMADRLEGQACAQVVTGAEAVWQMAELLGPLRSLAGIDPDDLALGVEYLRGCVERVATSPAVFDAVLVEWFDELIAGQRSGIARRDAGDSLLARLELAALDGDVGELVEVCARGWRRHGWLVGDDGRPAEILRLAHRVGAVGALRAAVHPQSGPARLAPADRQRPLALLALDLLAHLAADVDSGDGLGARAALLDLVGTWELAGEAAVRLPLHLLDDDERARLLDAHEARLQLLEADPVMSPMPIGMLRDSRIVRNALWQAFDASHL
jgi:hypothetical protein